MIIALPHIRKNASFYIYALHSTIIFQFLFCFRGLRHLLFNGVLFVNSKVSKYVNSYLLILKEIILLCMDYGIALRLENVESQK